MVPLAVVIGSGGAMGLLLVILVVLAIVYFAKRV